MHVVCLFTITVHLVSVHFGIHLCYNSKIFLFVLRSIAYSIFTEIVLRFIHSFILAQQKNKNESNTKPEKWNSKNCARRDKQKPEKNIFSKEDQKIIPPPHKKLTKCI